LNICTILTILYLSGFPLIWKVGSFITGKKKNDICHPSYETVVVKWMKQKREKTKKQKCWHIQYMY